MLSNREAIVYKISNIKNGKFYIGSTVEPKKRQNNHFTALRYNKHYNKKLQNSWNKYGEDSFKFEIIEISDEINILKREQYYIDILNPNYNICPIAYSTLGRKATKETKIKMSKAQTGRKQTEEAKLKVSMAHKGRIHSEDYKKNISNRQKKKVLQYDLDGNFIKEWNSGLEAKEKYNGVYSALNNRSKTSGGYIWKYKNLTTC